MKWCFFDLIPRDLEVRLGHWLGDVDVDLGRLFRIIQIYALEIRQTIQLQIQRLSRDLETLAEIVYLSQTILKTCDIK